MGARPLSEVVVRFTGTLDCGATRALLNAAVALPDEVGFVLDVSEARDVDDSAVAFLARSLVETTRSFELRGLSIHHERLLRYLGLPHSTSTECETARPSPPQRVHA